MKNSNSFCKAIEDPEHGCIWNWKPVVALGGTNVEISRTYDISPGFQNASVESSSTMKSMSDMGKAVFSDMLHTTDCYNREPRKSRISGREKYIEDDLDKELIRILKLDTKNTNPSLLNLKAKDLNLSSHPIILVFGLD